jgi:hypothetical protein
MAHRSVTRRSAHQLSRRTVLQRALLLGAGGWAAALAGCSSANNPPPPQDPTTTPSSTRTGVETTTANRILLAYFSRPGENYYYGGRRNLEVGNTEVLARMIAELIDCNVYRIAAADPYPASYDATVARNVREQNADARPAIADPLASIKQYDTVLLGSPIWERPTPDDHDHLHPELRLHREDGASLRHLRRQRSRKYRTQLHRLLSRARIALGLAVQGEEVTQHRADVETGFAMPDYSPPECPAYLDPARRFSTNPPARSNTTPRTITTARPPRTTEGRRWTSDHSAPWRCRRLGWAAWASAPTTATRSTPITGSS